MCCASGYLLLLFRLLLLGLFVGALLAQRVGKRLRKVDLEENMKEGVGSYDDKRCDERCLSTQATQT